MFGWLFFGIGNTDPTWVQDPACACVWPVGEPSQRRDLNDFEFMIVLVAILLTNGMYHWIYDFGCLVVGPGDDSRVPAHEEVMIPLAFLLLGLTTVWPRSQLYRSEKYPPK